MARPLRIEYPGAVYHVVTRGNNRQKIFRDDHDRKGYLSKAIFYYRQVKAVEWLCYCLLVESRPPATGDTEGQSFQIDAAVSDELHDVF